MKHAITGAINSGKSYFAREIKKRLPYQIIEVDDIRRHILWVSEKKEHVELRENLGNYFSLPTLGKAHNLNREVFTHKIFESSENLYNYSLISTPIIQKYIENIQEENSFLVWVFILEEEYYKLCNGLVIDIISPNKVNDSFLFQRSLIQNSSLFKRKKNPDIIFNQGSDIDSFIKRYL